MATHHLLKNYNTACYLVAYLSNPLNKNLREDVHPLVSQWDDFFGYLLQTRESHRIELTFNREIDINTFRYVAFTNSQEAMGWRGPDGSVIGGKPWWLHASAFHESHRSALLSMDYIYYSRFGWDLPITNNFWWPIRGGGVYESQFRFRNRILESRVTNENTHYKQRYFADRQRAGRTYPRYTNTRRSQIDEIVATLQSQYKATTSR